MVLCAAYGCDTDSKTHKISMYSFPKKETDNSRRQVWINRLNRGQSATKKFAPNKYSKLCAKHFEESQFKISRVFAEQIGFSEDFRLYLKPDAVPTIFENPNQKTTSKERTSAAAIMGKRLIHELKQAAKSSNTHHEPANEVIEEAMPFEDCGPFTAVPLPVTTAAATTDSVITTSVITTTAVSSSSVCHTVQTNSFPLTWFAELTSNLQKAPVVSSHSDSQTAPNCPLTWFADVATATVPETTHTTPDVPSPDVSMSSDVNNSSHKKKRTETVVMKKSTRGNERRSSNQSHYEMQTQTPHNLVNRRSVMAQCGATMVEKGTQTKRVLELPPLSTKPDDLNDSLMSVQSDDPRDPDWQPEDCDSDFVMNEPATCSSEAKEQKYIVFDSCLDELLNHCSMCGSQCFVMKKTIGSCLVCDIKCVKCEHEYSWRSQPMSGNMPMGNLILSAALMFSGCNTSKFLRALDFASISNISLSTYNIIQTSYLTPTILEVWNTHKDNMVINAKEDGQALRLGGDMRCCSPGHTAKYGSYTTMNLTTGHVMDIQLVQSNEVRNSHAMELEGLKRSLSWLIEDNDLTVSHLITDRHASVKKYMREEQTDIQHWFDVWHCAKGIYKKLEAAGKKKGCQKVKDWARSVSNHMYWCAASSGGDGELVQQKWLSILNHVTDVHEGHGDKFPRCQHGQLEPRDWMIKGYKPYAELEKVVKGRLLVNDIKKLSPLEQTSSLESFHNIVCQFAPKSVHYFYSQMEARLALAALHFNENTGRAQAVTKDGQPQFKIAFPKSRHGDAIAKEVKTQMSFGYVEELLEVLLEKRKLNKSYARAKLHNSLVMPMTPKPIAHSTPGPKPRKEDVVKAHIARFNKSK